MTRPAFWKKIDKAVKSVFKPKYDQRKYDRVLKENLAIAVAVDADPAVLHQRALTNLERAKQVGEDKLIMLCARTCAEAALRCPAPQYNMAYEALQEAAEKAETLDIQPALNAIRREMQRIAPQVKLQEVADEFAAESGGRRSLNQFAAPAAAPPQIALAPVPEDMPATEHAAEQGETEEPDWQEWVDKLLQDEDIQEPRSVAEINVEIAAIVDLIEHDPNTAYYQARTNLVHAIHTQHDMLIAMCAQILRQAAENYRPCPKFNVVIAAYRLVAEKCLAFGIEAAYAIAQNDLGVTYANLPTGDLGANLLQAICCYESALRIRTETAFPQDYAKTQNNLGNAYAQLPSGNRSANLREAMHCFENALRIWPESDFPNEYAVTQHNLGHAYAQLPSGDHSANLHQAMQCFENALRIWTEGDFPAEYALAQNNLGIAYADLSTGDRSANLRRAILCYENALRIRTEAAFPQAYAMTQNSLGNAYAQLSDGDRSANLRQAIRCYYRALRIQTVTAFPRAHARTKENLDWAYRNLLLNGDIPAIVVLYQEALALFPQDRFPDEHASAQFGLTLAQADIEEDASPAERIEAIIRDWIAQGRTERKIGELYTQAKNYAQTDPLKASILCGYAIRLLEEALRPHAAPARQRRLAEDVSGAYHLMIGLCLASDKPLDAFGFAERGKSRTLLELLQLTHLQPSPNVPPALWQAWQTTHDVLRELRFFLEEGQTAAPRTFVVGQTESNQVVDKNLVSCFVQRVPPGKPEPLERLIPEAQAAEHTLLDAISTHDPAFADTMRVRTVTLAEIAAWLPETTACIECFTGRDGTHLFVLRRAPETSLTVLTLPDLTTKTLFETWISEHWLRPYATYQFYRTADARQAWRNALEAMTNTLAKQFWNAKSAEGPSLSELIAQANAERLLFMPHSGLHLLPLHLIPCHAGPLLDHYEIAYAPSLTVLRFALQRERSDVSHLLAMANPTRDPTLKFMDGEVHAISAHFSEPQVLWHEQAKKTTVYEQAKKANILHFSCHGSFRPDDPLESRLLLAGNEDDEKKDLTLHDIFAKLKLPNASTVVLSACETGMVQLETGDEYIGLPSGFLYAGAATVISSLWAVDDLSTSLLMNRLYENMIPKKMGKAAALREAQLWVRDLTYQKLVEYLEQASLPEHIDYEILRGFQRSAKRDPDKKPFEHPYYWGAFTCHGSWE